MTTVVLTAHHAPLEIEVRHEPIVTNGACFRVSFTMADQSQQVSVWLMPAQLQQLGFAVSCAEQEADLQRGDYPGADYYPEGGPDGDEGSMRRMCRHGNLRRECEACDYEAAAEAFAQP